MKLCFPFEAGFCDARLEPMGRKKIDIAVISPCPQTFFCNLKDDLATLAHGPQPICRLITIR